MTVRGIEAINLYLPPNKSKIDNNIHIEQGRVLSTEQAGAAVNAVGAAAMNSADRYGQEWLTLLSNLEKNPELIREAAFSGELKISKFRSIYWALLLRVLNVDHRTWNCQREQQRLRYIKLKQEFVKNPHDSSNKARMHDDDPLSQSTQSIWNQYFSDQELVAVIKQDVVRTFPGVDFFRKDNIQAAMTNILFYYAREHPYMGYRQGMHEVLAPILFVVYADHQALLHYKEVSKTSINATLLDVLDPNFLEADSYSIFSRVMSSIESYYRVSTALQSHMPNSREISPTASTQVEVIGQLNSIRDKILAKEDLHLHNYLVKLDIPLHIFGIRWLRLLFGREFPLLDLLMLWDAIFADSDRFDLPNYIMVAMLIHIRGKLLLSDYTTCLTYLMRYPPNVDISLILNHALHMQVPKKYDQPANAFVYFTMSEYASGPAHVPANITMANAPMPYNPPTTSARKPVERNRKQSENSRTSQSFSEASKKIEQQIEQQQARNAEYEAMLEARRLMLKDSDSIMDGYRTNSPELLRLELRNAQTVISVAHNKLEAYLSTIRKYVGHSKFEELNQAVDGIGELCNLLDVRFMFPLQMRSAPIDHALEANENRALPANSSKAKPSAQPTKQLQIPQSISKKTAESSGNSRNSANSYEKPDNGFLHQSRVLGNLREFELMQIATGEMIEESHDTQSARRQGMPVVDPIGQSKEE